MADTHHTRRMLTGLGGALAALVLGGSTFLAWLTTGIHGTDGDRAAISGWGQVSGGSSLDGMNLNAVAEALGGHGSYRPAVVVIVAAIAAMICGLIVAVTGADRRPSRPVSAVMGLAGLAAAAWATVKMIAPGDAMGILPEGQRSVGAGPLVALIAGLVIAALATLPLSGLLDPPAPKSRRGIQPAR